MERPLRNLLLSSNVRPSRTNSKMNAKLCCFLFLASCLLELSHAYSDCGSEVGEIVDIKVSNCDNTKKCILKRNTNTSIEITFKSDADSDSLKAKVYGVILGVPMPFNLPNPDGCKDSGISCPVKKGETYKYTASLAVLEEYPKMSLDVKWELLVENGKAAVCALIPAKIQ